MKLWKKVTVICSVVLIVLVSLCSGILLKQTQDKMLSLTYEQAAEKQRNLAASFREMMNYYAAADDSYAVRYALASYCFSRFADGSAVLMQDNNVIFSSQNLLPEDYLKLSADERQVQIASEIQGKQMLITGSTLHVRSREIVYSVYTVEDITPIYDKVYALIRQFIWIDLACLTLGLLLIVGLVRYAMMPLEKLKLVATDIADGSYSQRVPIYSDDEIGALSESFNRMANSVETKIQELTEQTERQQLFIAGVTHEFKTPLTALLLNADTLQNTYMNEEEQTEAFAVINRQCHWLEHLVQKLLKLLTLRQDITMENVYIPDLLEWVQENTKEMLKKRGISLVVQCQTEYMEMDSDLMQSVLVNLIDNASKASEPGQIIRLTVREHLLEVSDSGRGIPAEELGRITEPFYMVDRSRSKQQGGVGLGLALVNEIVKAHGGKWNIDSKLGEGTSVRIYLE